MTDERDRGTERPEGSDDLFEDLDTFFKPIEDLDAEEPAPQIRPPTPNPASVEPPEPVPTAAGGWEPGDAGAEEEDDEILPSGWSAGLVTAPGVGEPTPSDEPPSLDMGDLFEVGEVEQPPLRTESAPFTLGEQHETPPPFPLGGSEEPQPSPEEPDPPVAPLSGDEWGRFRSALDAVGDVEEAAPPAVETPATSTTGDVFGIDETFEEEVASDEPAPVMEDPYVEATSRDDVIEPGAGAAPGPPRPTDEERAETGITLEDLRAMPSVYRDLPGPDDESEEPPLFAPAPPSEPTGELEGGDDEEPAAPSEEDLEAAADRFAASVRPTPEEVEADLLADLDQEEEGPRTVRVGPAEPSVAYPEEEEEPRRRVRVGAADPLAHGPSWQDDAAEEIEPAAAGAPAAGGARNIPAALIVAAVLAAAALITLRLGRAPFAFFAGAVLLAAQGEFYAATMRGRRYHPATALGLIFGALVLVAGYNKGETAMGAMLVLSMVFTPLWYMATPARARRNTMASIAITVFGVLYIPFLAGHAILLLTFEPFGRALLIAILALTFVNDAIAYAAGSFFGGHTIRRPLAASVSPRKSWEGTIVATGALVIVGLLVLPRVLDIFDGRAAAALGLALVVAVAGTFGDLAESLLKRDLKIKDMGTLFPGHGGALDRIDSVLFAAPAAYFYLQLVF